MSGTTGMNPKGSIGQCAYEGMDEIVVQVNQVINVNFTGGTPPFYLRRLEDNGMETQCTYPYLQAAHPLPAPLLTPSFKWTVEPPHTLWQGYPNGSSIKLTYGNPGDSTLFVIMSQEEVSNGTAMEHSTRYWTSPRFVVGADPLPVPRSASRTWLPIAVVAFIIAGLLIAILIGRHKRVKRLDVGGGAEGDAGERERLISRPERTVRGAEGAGAGADGDV